MTLAIMQPYFLPYLGYFQLINSVDSFVVYDNIQYCKRSYVNKNCYLCNNLSKKMTISLKKDSDYLDISQRVISEQFDKNKLLNQLHECYKKTPFYNEIFPTMEQIILFQNKNLFDYVFNSIKIISNTLNLTTNFIISSSISIDHSLKSQAKVIEICKKLQAYQYINAIGGQELYQKENFQNNNIDLKFIKMNQISYPQFNHDFVQNLSIIDVLMFNGKEGTRKLLSEYTLI